jgi:hypothetical protein
VTKAQKAYGRAIDALVQHLTTATLGSLSAEQLAASYGVKVADAAAHLLTAQKRRS